MRRKVVKHGSSTLTVSLPSKWAKRFGVHAGDELEVTENNQTLAVTTDNELSLERTSINLDELGLFNKNFLSNVYQLGYDEVTVHFDKAETYREILRRLSDCIGYEIINQGERYCVIKSIAQISHTEFDKVLSRTFLILLGMSRDCLDAIQKQEYSRLKEVRQMEAANNKLTDYCRRILNKKGYPDPKKTTILYSLVHDLEKIADDYKHLCDSVSSYDRPLGKDTLSLLKDVHEYLDTFYHLYYKFDMQRTTTLFTKGKKMREQAFALFGERDRVETEVLHHLANLTTKIYELTLPYFQIRFADQTG